MIPIPSFEQEKLFIEKTVTHIHLVQDNMYKIALSGGILGVSSSDIMRRAFLHDSSKFDKDIYQGYIWYNVRNNAYIKGLPKPDFNHELEDFIFNCVKKHRSQSRHHPEYYDNINDMEPLDLIEMVSDWVAISREIKSGLYKSSRDFADKMIGSSYMFDKKHAENIYAIIEKLAELNGKEW